MSQHTLAGFRTELQRRSERIRRAVSLLKISFGPIENQAFVVHAWWKGGEYERRFELSDFASGDRWRYRPCQFTQLLIQDILRVRNI